MNPNQIRTLIHNGEEIASHTVDHRSLVTLFPNQVRWELTVSQQTLQQQFGQKIDDFASPYGEVKESVLQQIRGVYASHRGVDSGLNDPRDFDPYNIQCVTIENTTTFAQIKQSIDQAIQTKAWLVLAFHQIDTSHQQYSVTPEFLEHILAYVASHPIPSVTIEQALSEIDQQI